MAGTPIVRNFIPKSVTAVCVSAPAEYPTMDSPIPDRWQLDGWKFRRCPRALAGEDVGWLIGAYNYMQLGILPRAGGWVDQSNKFIQAMQITMQEINKISKEEKHGSK